MEIVDVNLTKNQNVDTIYIAPKFYDADGDLCYIIVDEVKHPTSNTCYSFPTVKFDNGEIIVSDALHDFEEETGIKITENLSPVGDVTHNSQG